jgi:hypothetical protein
MKKAHHHVVDGTPLNVVKNTSKRKINRWSLSIPTQIKDYEWGIPRHSLKSINSFFITII